MKRDGSTEPLSLRQVLNKIIHGTPTQVVVQDGTVKLYFRNNFQNSSTDEWTEAWFSGTQLLNELNSNL